ncbi:hypothetical protein BDR03DRAFT_964050 [Suillus americanus]|nr:hypothetical protein BDR03DRAFT_964050 [Suillus americanus]
MAGILGLVLFVDPVGISSSPQSITSCSFPEPRTYLPTNAFPAASISSAFDVIPAILRIKEDRKETSCRMALASLH